MTNQKINTPAPGLYPSCDVTQVVPTSQPHGLYFALRYLYDTNKDVNDWYNIKKSGGDYDQFYKEIKGDYNPWHTTNFRNGVK